MAREAGFVRIAFNLELKLSKKHISYYPTVL